MMRSLGISELSQTFSETLDHVFLLEGVYDYILEDILQIFLQSYLKNITTSLKYKNVYFQNDIRH